MFHVVHGAVTMADVVAAAECDGRRRFGGACTCLGVRAANVLHADRAQTTTKLLILRALADALEHAAQTCAPVLVVVAAPVAATATEHPLRIPSFPHKLFLGLLRAHIPQLCEERDVLAPALVELVRRKGPNVRLLAPCAPLLPARGGLVAMSGRGLAVPLVRARVGIEGDATPVADVAPVAARRNGGPSHA